MAYRIVSLVVALAASLLAGCSKAPSQALTKPKSVELGTVELTYGQPNRQDLGDKLVCVFTAQPLSPGSCELIARLEQSGKEVAITRQAPTALDQPLHLAFGKTQISLTPHIK